MSSVERIRERFLHKIGIPPQQSMTKSFKSSHPSLASQTMMNSETELSCLGKVNPDYVPLKVGLDDDSSFDEDDDYDDDFYFDDHHFPSEMDIDTFVRNSQNESIKKMFSIENKKPFMEENGGQIHIQRTDESSLGGSVNLISENGSANSSVDGGATNLSCTTPCFSAGNLTFVSNDSSVETRSAKRPRLRRKVSLNHQVAVVPIPMRGEYPDPVRARLWSTASELYENAVRNSVEYASEGWNWRAAVEDESMIVDNNSGDLIHPIHLHNLFQFDANNPSNSSQAQQQQQAPPLQPQPAITINAPDPTMTNPAQMS